MISFLSVARQQHHQITQVEAAEKLGVSIVTVRRMENDATIGKVAHNTIIAYCQLLEIKEIKVPEIVKSE